MEKTLNMVDLLEDIHKKQLESFIGIEEFKNSMTLPTHHRGLYWIWTNFSFEELSKLLSGGKPKVVPISNLVEQRKDLKGICKVEKDGFTVVYNGIGGYKKNANSFGLRERILQELNCNSESTGTLNVLNRSEAEGDKERWSITYFDFDDPENMDTYIRVKSIFSDYPENAKALELMWRLEYGMPILSRL